MSYGCPPCPLPALVSVPDYVPFVTKKLTPAAAAVSSPPVKMAASSVKTPSDGFYLSYGTMRVAVASGRGNCSTNVPKYSKMEGGVLRAYAQHLPARYMGKAYCDDGHVFRRMNDRLISKPDMSNYTLVRDSTRLAQLQEIKDQKPAPLAPVYAELNRKKREDD